MMNLNEPVDAEATWTLDQINNVRRLWMKALVDRSLDFMSNGQAEAFSREQAALALCEEAHTFGVEVHPGDIAFDVTRNDTHITIEARWHPQTRNVELLGGVADGKVYALSNPYEPFRVPRLSNPTCVEPMSGDMVTFAVDEYRLTGWRERERRWVMKIAPTS